MSYFRLFAVAVVVMGLSHTIAKERIFAAFRQVCARRGELAKYLVGCPFCLSYWIAFAIVPITRTYAIDVTLGPRWLSWIVTWLLSSVFVAVAAAFLRVGFYFIDEEQGLLRRREKLEQIALEREERRHRTSAASTPPPSGRVGVSSRT